MNPVGMCVCVPTIFFAYLSNETSFTFYLNGGNLPSVKEKTTKFVTGVIFSPSCLFNDFSRYGRFNAPFMFEDRNSLLYVNFMV